jgi:hypothetical protein
MNDNSVNRKAKELIDNVKITSRIAALRKPVVEKAQITLKSHLDKLAELRDKADASEKWQAAIQAEVARGKASGLYVDKLMLSGDKENPLELLINQVSGNSFSPVQTSALND